MEEKTAQNVKEKNTSEVPLQAEAGKKEEKKSFNVLLIGCVGLVFLVFGLACGIGGFWFYENKIIKAPSVTPTPVVEPTPRLSSTLTIVPTILPTEKPTVTEGVIYKNETLDYYFEYDESWKALTNKILNTDCLFGPNATTDSGLGGVEVREHPGGASGYISYVEKNADVVYTSREDVVVNGMNGVRAKYEGFQVSGQAVVLEKGGKIFYIYINSDNSADIEKFDEIAASFRFDK